MVMNVAYTVIKVVNTKGKRTQQHTTLKFYNFVQHIKSNKNVFKRCIQNIKFHQNNELKDKDIHLGQVTASKLNLYKYSGYTFPLIFVYLLVHPL